MLESSQRTFAGQVAIVTGVRHGSGLAVAERLAGAGARLIVVDTDPAIAADVAAELRKDGSDVEPFAQGALKENSRASVAALALERYGSIEILVNASACGTPGRAADQNDPDLARADKQYGVACVLNVLPTMIANGYGRIVNVGGCVVPAYPSVPNDRAEPDRSCLHRMTLPLVRDIAPHGITLNSIACVSASSSTPPFKARRTTLLARYGSRPDNRLRGFDQMGAIAMWLASTGAAFLHGQILYSELDGRAM